MVVNYDYDHTINRFDSLKITEISNKIQKEAHSVETKAINEESFNEEFVEHKDYEDRLEENEREEINELEEQEDEIESNEVKHNAEQEEEEEIETHEVIDYQEKEEITEVREVKAFQEKPIESKKEKQGPFVKTVEHVSDPFKNITETSANDVFQNMAKKTAKPGKKNPFAN